MSISVEVDSVSSNVSESSRPLISMLGLDPIAPCFVMLSPELREFAPLCLHLTFKLQKFDLDVHLQSLRLMCRQFREIQICI